MYQPGEGRVKPFFSCHLFLLCWLHPAGKHNQSLILRQGAQMSDRSSKTASGMLNSARKQNSIPIETGVPRRQECELGDAWSPPQSLIPVSPISHPGSLRNVSWGQPSSSCFNVTSMGGREWLCPWLSLEARDVLSHKPPARGLQRSEVFGS